MPRKAQWPPPIHRHSSGQARVRIAGVVHYLGAYGSEAAAKQYARLVGGGEPGPRLKGPLSVAAAVELYDGHARGHYRKPDGTQTSEVGYVVRACSYAVRLFGKAAAEDFRGKALKKVRDAMVEAGWCRSNVNHHVNVIKRCWKWLLAEELVSAECYGSLRAVEALKSGRTEAPDRPKVLPAEPAHVEAAVPFLTPHLRAAVRLQLACGCRPGEALALRPCDVREGEGGVWLWELPSHKTAHHGKARLVVLGPQAQEAIGALLKAQCPDWPADPGAKGARVLFNPKRSEKERRAAVRAGAKSPRRSPLAGRYPVGTRFTVEAYAKAVARACKNAEVPHWHPNRLRHLAGTRFASEFGVEVARILLGHANVKVTELYAECDMEKARAAMLRSG